MSVIISLYVQPGASKTSLVGLHNGMPKIALKAKPVDGEANKALIAFLANLLGTTKASIEILSGQSSRHKRVSLPEDSFNRLNGLLQDQHVRFESSESKP
ncbi:MAG: hypothetical protein RLY30_874 [Pseudomonadota bacterium]|jgi:uncharacterized protein (TIGR00251 family)